MKKLITLLMMSFVMMISSLAYAQCDAPTGLSASYNNGVTTFTWNLVPGNMDYTIEIKQSQDPWEGAEIVQAVNGNTYSINLYHSLTVDWRVNTNCGASVSAYSVAQFTVPCPQPSSLNVTNITAGGATLNWIPDAGFNTFISDFVASYRLANTSNAWTQIGHTQTNSINVAGLNPNTSYEWCINQTCPYFNSTAVFGTFTTAVPTCQTPANVAFSYNNNVSTFTWVPVPGVTNYKIQLGWAGANWGTVEQTVSGNTYNVTNLMQGGNFQFRVRANCGSSYSYYAPILFSTPCSAPGSLTTTSITTTGATLNWVPAIGNNTNTVFAVGYRVAGTNNAWTSIGNTSASTINVTGLTPGIVYQWCVNKVCSNTSSNPVIALFATANNNCASYGSNSAEWIDLFKLGSINRVSGAEAGGYLNTGLNTNLVIGSTGNTAQISAGFSGTVRNQKFSIYIDLNRNGSYADPGERITGPLNITGSGTINFSVNIPSGVTAGAAGMRVIMRRSSGTITGCITGFLGETEDYTVNLVTTNSFQSLMNKGNESVAVTGRMENDKMVSPNPSSGRFNITLPDSFSPVEFDILNTSGTVIKKGNLHSSKQFTVDLITMPAGIYLMRLRDLKGRNELVKLLKN